MSGPPGPIITRILSKVYLSYLSSQLKEYINTCMMNITIIVKHVSVVKRKKSGVGEILC